MAWLELLGIWNVFDCSVLSTPADVSAPTTPDTGMAACAAKGANCALSACYPCYCGGLTAVESQFAGDGDWLGAAKKECAPYINSFDVKSQSVKVGISLLIVVINNVLTVLLQVLVGFEKHWTKSDKERAYAVAAFVSQLLNSVMVLLLVNAQLVNVSDAINTGLSSVDNEGGRWFQNLILAGSYRDFSPGWWVEGFSWTGCQEAFTSPLHRPTHPPTHQPTH